MSKTRFPILVTVIAALLLIPGEWASAQEDDKSKKKKKKEIPPVEVVELTTKDGVVLKCLWYGGTKGKESVPVIMLHDWDANRGAFAKYAKQMQKENGCAIIVPDLRGHGESKYLEDGTELDPDRWKPAEIATAVADIEACKKFLVQKNNEGELNIDLLTVVAEGVTCIHAIEWSINDWAFGYLGGVKQGKDVKSLVLMGPKKSYRSLTLTQMIKDPLFSGHADLTLSMLVLGNADNGAKAVKDSKTIYSTMERLRKEGRDSKKHIYFFEYQTKEQSKVVENNEGDEIPLASVLVGFIENENKRFKDDHRWQDRSR